MRAQIVILPGDGVGPEVTAAAVTVLEGGIAAVEVFMAHPSS